MFWGYKGSFLLLNNIQFPILDQIMPHYTHLGDGVLITSIFSLLIIKRDKSMVVSLLFTMIMVSLIVFIAKRWLFPDWNRPLLVFEGLESFNYLATVPLKRYAFPSGHSMAAAAMFTYIAYFISAHKPMLQALIAFISISIAYSRLYIGVHFLGDILVGTLIGVCLSLLCLERFYPWMKTVLQEESRSLAVLKWALYLFSSGIFFLSIYSLYIEHYQ